MKEKYSAATFIECKIISPNYENVVITRNHKMHVWLNSKNNELCKTAYNRIYKGYITLGKRCLVAQE